MGINFRRSRGRVPLRADTPCTIFCKRHMSIGRSEHRFFYTPEIFPLLVFSSIPKSNLYCHLSSLACCWRTWSTHHWLSADSAFITMFTGQEDEGLMPIFETQPRHSVLSDRATEPAAAPQKQAGSDDEYDTDLEDDLPLTKPCKLP